LIRFFDAFAGIGGFRSAFEKVGGYECVGFCEIDKHAQKAYRSMFDTGGQADETSSSAEKNSSPNQFGDLHGKSNFLKEENYFYENIRNIETARLGEFDLLVGGFPCQPFSVAGKRKSFEDDRGDLFFELARILEDKRPQYFIFENVPGLLGIEEGKAYRKILETLCELGYCLEWLVHNSADFGVPQSRKRVYIAGCLGADCTGKILAFGESNKKNLWQLVGGCQGQ
jgi:DNA (cytosine-5)-methyltransferase 1